MAKVTKKEQLSDIIKRYKIKTGKKYQTGDSKRCQKYGTKAENMSNPAEETTQTV